MSKLQHIRCKSCAPVHHGSDVHTQYRKILVPLSLFSPQKASQKIQDDGIIALHLAIGAGPIRSCPCLGDVHQLTEWLHHWTIKVSSLISVHNKGHSKSHRICLKERPCHSWSILNPKRNHFYPVGKLIHDHQDISVSLSTFTERPQDVKMYSIPREPGLVVL